MTASPLAFRPLRADDVDAMFALHGDPATNLFNPFGADPDVATTRRRLADWIAHAQRHGYGYDAVESGGRVIGICGARTDAWLGLEVVNLYWRLLSGFQGQGLSTPLAEHALAVARGRPGADVDGRTIVARMREGNAASRRVAERLGLVRRPELDADGWILFCCVA